MYIVKRHAYSIFLIARKLFSRINWHSRSDVQAFFLLIVNWPSVRTDSIFSFGEGELIGHARPDEELQAGISDRKLQIWTSCSQSNLQRPGRTFSIGFMSKLARHSESSRLNRTIFTSISMKKRRHTVEILAHYSTSRRNHRTEFRPTCACACVCVYVSHASAQLLHSDLSKYLITSVSSNMQALKRLIQLLFPEEDCIHTTKKPAQHI